MKLKVETNQSLETAINGLSRALTVLIMALAGLALVVIGVAVNAN